MMPASIDKALALADPMNKKKLTVEDVALYLHVLNNEVTGQTIRWYELFEEDRQAARMMAQKLMPLFIRARSFDEMIESIARYFEQNQCDRHCGAPCAERIRQSKKLLRIKLR